MKKVDEPSYAVRENISFIIKTYIKNIPFRTIRQKMYRFIIKNCGSNVRIGMNVEIRFPRRIFIGNNVGINDNVFILNHGKVTIGNNTLIGPGVIILTVDHKLTVENSEEPCWSRGRIIKPVKIENNVFIGAGSIILPGVTIGDWSVVGAGSVVTSDVPEMSIVAGNPAKLIRRMD
ncbi:MAG: DapH/DapD/GlmU-related protein [Candidatus Helarchaeota archaeon]